MSLSLLSYHRQIDFVTTNTIFSHKKSNYCYLHQRKIAIIASIVSQGEFAYSTTNDTVCKSLSRDELPTITLNSPGSTMRFILTS